MHFAGGKVILLGEHGVVYGRPALAAGLSRGVLGEASAAEEDRLVIPAFDLGVAPDPESEEPLPRAFAALLEGYGERGERARVKLDVGIPAGSGLGCSAAMGVATVAALDGLYDVERSAEARGHYSLRWERVFHGNPSGVDNMMAAAGGLAIYVKGEPLEPVRSARPLLLVVGDSGEPSSTKATVASVARYRERERERAEKIFDAMAALVGYAERALPRGDLAHIGQLFDLNQRLLSSLLLSTDTLEAMCKAAREAGALGAKLTGGGGGGAMIALCPDRDRAEAIREAVAKEGKDAFITEAGG